MSICKKPLFTIFGFITFALILTLPVIFFGFPFGHDAVFHLKRYTFFSQQLWTGDFYPRWLVGMDGGVGSPVFFYYPPVPYWLTSLLHPFFANDPQGWYQLGISATLALIASGLSAYIWLRNITNERAALIAALLYMAMPYHLAIDLYERSAFAEYWGFVWMPLIMYFVTRIIAGHKLVIIGLALSYALLIMTHPPTLLAFSIVPLCYAFLMVDTSKRLKILLTTLGTMMLGAGLSAIYLIPAMTTQEYVPVQLLWKETYYYEKSFLLTGILRNLENPPHLIYMIKIHWVVITMVCVASGVFFTGFSKINKLVRRERSFWFVIAIMSIFMMLPLSKPIWQIFPVLQMIQQPWRFNIVLALATTALVGLGIFPRKNPNPALTRKLFAIAVLLLISWAFMTAWTAFHTIKVHKEAINKGLESIVDIVDSEYRPTWVHSKTDYIGENQAQVKIVAGTGSMTVLRWKPRNILLEVNTPSGVLLNINQVYYPGWTAQVARDESGFLPVQPSSPEGLLSVSVPSGKHEVLLRLTAGFAESFGQTVSTVAALMTMCLAIWFAHSEYNRVVP